MKDKARRILEGRRNIKGRNDKVVEDGELSEPLISIFIGRRGNGGNRAPNRTDRPNI